MAQATGVSDTLILKWVNRADMFGLAQLYQLRGRIGRSKLRGYAYLTTPPGKALPPARSAASSRRRRSSSSRRTWTIQP